LVLQRWKSGRGEGEEDSSGGEGRGEGEEGRRVDEKGEERRIVVEERGEEAEHVMLRC
jgi:hypothetical protein